MAAARRIIYRVVETAFELLFKYRRAAFEQGQLAVDAPWAVMLLVGILVLAALPLVLGYRTPLTRARPRDRAILAAFRLTAVALVAFCLLRPVLLVSVAVPRQNVLAVLIDDSRSMGIADVGGLARREAVARRFTGADGALLAELGERFVVRTFRFARRTERLDDLSALGAEGRRTHVASAITDVRRELTGVPLAGIVLVTDGADNAPPSSSLDVELGALAAAGVPVFAVGVGRERYERDIEIREVSAPRHVLEGASFVATVAVAHDGYDGERVQVVAEDGGRIIATSNVTLPRGGGVLPVRMRIPAADAGPRRLAFRVPARAGETIAENNVRQTSVVVRGERAKILYVEGEPRFELKFIRRALSDDRTIQVVALQRTAEGKFLRLGVDDSLQLAGGFPATREELFGYSGIILGSVEASFFSLDQSRMLADFVGERGGGLLMLGGRQSCGEGGYAGTPLADVLPVELEAEPGQPGEPFFSEVRVALTRAGAAHAATQIAATEDASAERWRSLPPLSAVNRVHRVKPGATTLLAGSGTPDARDRPVLAYQRYGRGLAIAFPVQDSWLWQMHSSVPVEDLSHETLWRQLLRWLVSEAHAPIVLEAATGIADLDQTVSLRARVHDRSYLALNDADAVVAVTSPSGATVELPMPWTVTADGEYGASFTADEAGTYELRVRARAGGQPLSEAAAHVDAAELNEELFDATMRAAALQRIARETGGRFYTLDQAGALPRDVVFTRSGSTMLERRDLWDMPLVFLLLLSALAGEWIVRRRRGFA